IFLNDPSEIETLPDLVGKIAATMDIEDNAGFSYTQVHLDDRLTGVAFHFSGVHTEPLELQGCRAAFSLFDATTGVRPSNLGSLACSTKSN
ncbi:MAG: hypothetical protein VXZ09_11010, partial [Pseudomonadota bacterium]|nr:hypothetical protein [Pseudomonadota bacterium]